MRSEAGKRLAALRRRVDVLDGKIIRLLAARQRLVAAMKPLKPSLRDPAREESILRLVARQARRAGADRAFVGTVYRGLLKASRSFLGRI